jgi:hypothetical protein
MKLSKAIVLFAGLAAAGPAAVPLRPTDNGEIDGQQMGWVGEEGRFHRHEKRKCDFALCLGWHIHEVFVANQGGI